MPRPARRALAVAAAIPLLLCPPAAAFFRLPSLRTQRNANITLRKRLHVNTLITEPGTIEIDWSNLYSVSTGNFEMPSALKIHARGQAYFLGTHRIQRGL